MLRLTTLGAIWIVGVADARAPHPILSQPKRLALLAYLLLARPGSLVFRDTLVAMLWPDYETGRARRALRQTLHHLRSEFGSDLILGPRAESVGLNPELIWCDAVELERALVEDRLEAVLELYGGEFLPGFHPPCGPEFERWLDEVRDRLRHKVTLAAATLAERAETSGDVRGAVEYATRLVDLLPFDEQAARVKIRLLAQTGNRAAAVEAYRALAARLEHQLELGPDSRTRALAEAVFAGAGDYLGREQFVTERAWKPGDQRHPDGRSLAVLPFAPLSGADSERIFAEGLSEMLITELTRRGCVSVVSRTSVQPFRRGATSLPAVARALSVDLVVEGTVLVSGDRLRVTAQLLRAIPERHLWADSFERDVADPLALQAELADTLANRIEAALIAPAGDLGGSANTGAREAYFRARCHFARMTPDGFANALRLLREAVRLDSRFARAHAALGYALAALARTGQAAPREAFVAARHQAERALELDANLSEGHIVLGICATFLERNWEQAEAHMRRGLELGPDLPDSFWCYSNLLLITGRHGEAVQASRRARELDPVLPTLWLNEVLIGVGAGALAQAEESAAEFAAFHRDSSASAFALGMVREARGDHEAAATHFAHAEAMGGGPHSIAGQGHNLACAGRADDARRLLQRLLRVRDRYVPATAIARIHAALGDAEDAFRWLKRAAAESDAWVLFIDNWPRFEQIRDDRRFSELRRELLLPERIVD